MCTPLYVLYVLLKQCKGSDTLTREKRSWEIYNKNVETASNVFDKWIYKEILRFYC